MSSVTERWPFSTLRRWLSENPACRANLRKERPEFLRASRSPGPRLSGPAGLTLVVVVFTLVFIGPLYFLFSDGLKSTTEAVQVPPTIIPAHLHLSTYGSAWSRVGLARLLVNTLYYAFGALFFQLIFDVAAAYSLSRLRPFGGRIIFAL